MKLSERFNEVIAFEFDLACAARLKLYDEERELRMYEALGMGSVSNMMGGTQSTPTSGATVIQAGWSVPDA